jgi:tetratricopeptide (TPR) repeat protein
MAAPHSTVKTAAAATALVCVALVFPVQMRIDSLRRDLVKENVMPTQMPLSAAASAALGGFRGLAVDMLWMQSDSMINERQFYQLITYYTLISTLQPNFPSVWVYNAWNLAYNISAEWGQPDEKWLWIKKGIEFAKEGLIYNPESAELNFYAGWLYFSKVAKNSYFAAKIYQEDGIEPYLEAYKYFKKAAEISQKAGETDVRVSNLEMRTLFEYGKAVLVRTGNVPEAMRHFDRAEEGTRMLAAQFPDDAATLSLADEIRKAKAQFQK